MNFASELWEVLPPMIYVRPANLDPAPTLAVQEKYKGSGTPVMIAYIAGDPDDSATQERGRLIAAAPRMLHLLQRLRDDILRCSIDLDNREQQAGFDSAARAIGLKRVTELLREIEGVPERAQ